MNEQAYKEWRTYQERKGTDRLQGAAYRDMCTDFRRRHKMTWQAFKTMYQTVALEGGKVRDIYI